MVLFHTSPNSPVTSNGLHSQTQYVTLTSTCTLLLIFTAYLLWFVSAAYHVTNLLWLDFTHNYILNFSCSLFFTLFSIIQWFVCLLCLAIVLLHCAFEIGTWGQIEFYRIELTISFTSIFPHKPMCLCLRIKIRLNLKYLTIQKGAYVSPASVRWKPEISNRCDFLFPATRVCISKERTRFGACTHSFQPSY